ncbi:MAG: polymerase protein [Candidatus Gottesmanbacteria bacterium GW2011_GWA2_44_17]|uniref:Polymerase protein n=3 Tax=Candidatus Gottesmaniibacteriota TaxID=1752720 RepID=A0A0G1LFJ1_9BACT|nr:MAG: polymerase protein [Candidatus Gottesmanbacteria bacterium GW2011_GWB1_44_11c]KKT46367.1 MAG: polymerase protein [Candidatus Gottesmanbacteria bacterium GW2011_GWA2_44_17]KKT58759.1 MAG: polymerase protein [Candidatus Gottesmanbacteria bacterium GW2011_GWA1_44_24b]HCM82855.1 hypothetical protein [Patescibacteria group bacterium]
MDKSRANQVQQSCAHQESSSRVHLVPQSSAHQAPTRLVLIDGNAILHRAFHALPPLTAPDGRVVNAVYGFTTMLLRLIRDLQPTHLAVAFDRPAPTFRKELYKEYQAKRPKMDEALIPQVDKIHDLLTAFSIPIFEKDGFEADDIMGTIVHDIIDEHKIKTQDERKKSRANLAPSSSAHQVNQIIIVTGDRDLLQLVEDDKILVYMPTKGLSEGKLYGEKETEERLGVKPSLVPDYKALAGDASDNYPGIPGIGPKTAVEILKKAGSIDSLYASIGKKSFGLSDALVQKIREGKESALLSHQLATINREVPINIDIPTFSENQMTKKQAIEMLQTFGFRSLIKRLEKREDGKRDNEIKKKRNIKKEDAQIGLF